MTRKKEPENEKKPPERSDAGQEPEQAEVEVDTMPEEARPSQPPEGTEILVKKNQELLSKLMYLQADFENYQKRALKERQEIIASAQEGLMRSILPILDDLDKAVEMVGEADAGLAMVRTKLLKILEQSGLAEIPAKGENFDPFLHDAVEYTGDSDLEDGTIKEVVRKGYRCNTKVLRPSLVVVVKKEGEKNA